MTDCYKKFDLEKETQEFIGNKNTKKKGVKGDW
jgi:hypothetical protein